MKRRTLMPLLLAFCCSLLITIGCGGNEPTTDAPDTSDAPAETTEAPSDQPLVMGYSSWAGWWPWAIAEEEGLFEEKWSQRRADLGSMVTSTPWWPWPLGNWTPTARPSTTRFPLPVKRLTAKSPWS
jgi:hypothetical protein